LTCARTVQLTLSIPAILMTVGAWEPALPLSSKLIL
jgi:hypothetical protein